MRDERGASALETAILLPLLILSILAGFQIWKLMMLRRALYVGTYQAARYLANYQDAFSSRYVGGGSYVGEQVRRFVEKELEGSRLYTEQMVLEEVKAVYGRACTDVDPRYRCGGYQVDVMAKLRVPLSIPPLLALESPLSIVLRGECRHDPCNDCSR